MPAIHGVYQIHPQTKVKGYWVHSCLGNSPIIGISQEELDSKSISLSNGELELLVKNGIESKLSKDPEFIIQVVIDKTSQSKVLEFTVSNGSSKIIKV